MRSCILLCSVWMLFYISASNAFRILLYPFDHKAHVNYFTIVGEELKSRGHDVDIIIASRSAHIAISRNITTYEQNYSVTLDASLFEKTEPTLTGMANYANTLVTDALVQAKEVLSNEKLINDLRNNKYDLALVDGSDPARVQLLVPYKLGVKYVTFNARHDPWNARVPSMPSVEPFFMSPFGNEISFFTSFANTMIHLALYYLVSPPSVLLSGIHNGLFDEFVPEKKNIGFQKLNQNCEMFFILMDQFCMDDIHVSAPHYQIIGGLGSAPAKTLPENLHKFMDKATSGVIIMTFGSGISRIPNKLLEPMLKVFSKLKQSVIIRHDGKLPNNVPKNVLIQSWLPQNDLLGHKNAKVFITHSGKSGQLEGVYHGVPMLMMPHFGDQIMNTDKALVKDFGLQVDPHEFNIKDFETNLSELLNNQKYANKIKHCSNILRSLPSAKDTAAFWIEHILQHGSEHLKPKYMDISLFKFFCLDVILACFVADLLLLFCLYKCFKRCFCKKTRKQKHE